MSNGGAEQFDVIIVGAGIAGASAGYFLSESHRVALLEREDKPGYHTTGRSAALFTESYGNESIRALTTGSRAFLELPPAGFCEAPLLTPRGVMLVGRADQMETLDRHYEEISRRSRTVRRLSADEALALCPVLRPDYVAGGLEEPACMDIDVAGLHQGYLKGLRARGGKVVTNAQARELKPAPGGGWIVDTPGGRFQAPVLVDAAGAWADEVAEQAGVRPVGLTPKRRTVMLIDPPEGIDISAWPMTLDVDEELYFKPDAGKLLLSPADETPSPPCDAQPDEMDIAIAIDRLEKMTTLSVRRIGHKWAGLRTFAPDKTLIAGFDPDVDGFFWLAGQGGYGIQTSPSMGRIAAALIADDEFPPDFSALGLGKNVLGVGRLRAGHGRI
jgi:D-arginine dehydrogenase